MKKKIIYGCEERGDYDKPYLIRWDLFSCKWFTVYFHKFVRSDADDLHDHPWNFLSIILWRGYNEETFKDLPGKDFDSHTAERIQKRYWPGMILFRSASHAHRVVLVNEKPAYTLVIRSKYIRSWGFFTGPQWQHFTEYFKAKGC